jgi:hypothetical protein
MRERLRIGLAGGAAGIGPYVVRAPWWTVALVMLVVMSATYLVVCWLAMHSGARRISTFFITWEGPEEPPPR